MFGLRLSSESGCSFAGWLVFLLFCPLHSLKNPFMCSFVFFVRDEDFWSLFSPPSGRPSASPIFSLSSVSRRGVLFPGFFSQRSTSPPLWASRFFFGSLCLTVWFSLVCPPLPVSLSLSEVPFTSLDSLEFGFLALVSLIFFTLLSILRGMLVFSFLPPFHYLKFFFLLPFPLWSPISRWFCFFRALRSVFA